MHVILPGNSNRLISTTARKEARIFQISVAGLRGTRRNLREAMFFAGRWTFFAGLDAKPCG